jgi:hypothetical protein
MYEDPADLIPCPGEIEDGYCNFCQEKAKENYSDDGDECLYGYYKWELDAMRV